MSSHSRAAFCSIVPVRACAHPHGVVGDQPLLYHNTLSANGTDHVYYQIPGGHDEGVYGNGFYNFLRYAFK